MIDHRFEKHDVRDQKLRDIHARVERDGRIGWPVVTATAVLVAAAVLVIIYVTLDACSSPLTD